MDIDYYIDKHPGVHDSVMKDMRQRLGYEENDTTPDEEILNMSGRDFLAEYLEWNGLIGFASFIIEAVYMAYGIDLENDPFDRDVERIIDRW